MSVFTNRNTFRTVLEKILTAKLAQTVEVSGIMIKMVPDLAQLTLYKPGTLSYNGAATEVCLEDGKRKFDTFLLKNLYQIAQFPDFDSSEVALPFTCKVFDDFYTILFYENWDRRGETSSQVVNYIRVTNFLMPIDEELYTIDSTRVWSLEGDILNELSDLITDEGSVIPNSVIDQNIDMVNIAKLPVYSTLPVMQRLLAKWKARSKILKGLAIKINCDDRDEHFEVKKYLEANREKLVELGYEYRFENGGNFLFRLS